MKTFLGVVSGLLGGFIFGIIFVITTILNSPDLREYYERMALKYFD